MSSTRFSLLGAGPEFPDPGLRSRFASGGCWRPCSRASRGACGLLAVAPSGVSDFGSRLLPSGSRPSCLAIPAGYGVLHVRISFLVMLPERRQRVLRTLVTSRSASSAWSLFVPRRLRRGLRYRRCQCRQLRSFRSDVDSFLQLFLIRPADLRLVRNVAWTEAPQLPAYSYPPDRAAVHCSAAE